MNARIPSVYLSSPLQVDQGPAGHELAARPISYVRLSITDLCNFRCIYCLPNGYRGKKKRHELSLNEITQLAISLAQLGVKKIRITGGEPSLRADLPQIIARLKHTAGIEQVVLTTNGYQMQKHIESWASAGLDGVNVSIDSFNAMQFAQLTGHDLLQPILDSVAQLAARQLFTVKINTVLMQCNHQRVLEDALAYIKNHDIDIRFIELMQTGALGSLFAQEKIAAAEMLNRLIGQGFVEQPRMAHAGPARLFSHAQYAGRIGVIAPYQPDFCTTCNRIRISSQGNLHLCLYDEKAYPLRQFLNQTPLDTGPLGPNPLDPSQPNQLTQHLLQLLHHKPSAHRLHDGNSGLIQQLAQIGG